MKNSQNPQKKTTSTTYTFSAKRQFLSNITPDKNLNFPRTHEAPDLQLPPQNQQKTAADTETSAATSSEETKSFSC